MRKQLVNTIEYVLETDKHTVLLLGDIGVWGFRDVFKKFPDRVFNIGICEQSTVSVMAGMALTGMIPIFHSIAPFMIERAYEQIKLDFGYQQLGGNFISVGSSYDYAADGCTHHCPADVAILSQIPNMEIIVPSTPSMFHWSFIQHYDNSNPTYYRLSSVSDTKCGSVVNKDSQLTILTIGPTYDLAVEAASDFPVTVLRCSTVKPFDTDLLREFCPSKKLLITEPFYEGTMLPIIRDAFRGEYVYIESMGIPPVFTDHYGTREELDKYYGFNVDDISFMIQEMINA